MAKRRAGERFVKDAPYDVRDKDAEIRAATSYVPRKSSRNGAVIFNIATFIATCAAVLGIAFAATGGVGIEAIVAMLLAALLVLFSLPAPFIIPLFADVGDDAEYVSTSYSAQTLATMLCFVAIAVYTMA